MCFNAKVVAPSYLVTFTIPSKSLALYSCPSFLENLHSRIPKEPRYLKPKTRYNMLFVVFKSAKNQNR